MGNNLTSAQSLAYQGTNAASPSNVTVHYNAPTANFYQGFSMGDFWVHRISPTSNQNELWVLMGVAGNVANWVLLTGNMGPLLSLTGNSGGAVFPLAGNINVVGDGTTIQVVGNPGTHTLTISAMGTGTVESLTTDDGHVVTPTAGTINVLTGLSTLNCGSTVEFTGTVGPNTVMLNVTSPILHNTIIGHESGNISISGSLNTVVGSQAAESLTGGENNCVLGFGALFDGTNATQNIAIGVESLEALITGSNNIAIGHISGNNYVGAESDNILLNSTGVVSELNTLRIGAATGTSDRQLKAAYICGIDGVNVGSVATVVTEHSDQLGTAVITAGSGIVVTPTANTITIAAAATVPQSFPTDSGTAVPSGGVLNIKAGVSTQNSGSSVEFTGSGDTVLLNVTDANTNTIIGKGAGNSSISGVNNWGLGNGVLFSLTSGSGNLAVGGNALNAVTSAIGNVAIGGAALTLCTGSNNIAIGNDCLPLVTSGITNTALGAGAGFNSTGPTGLTTGSGNILIGYGCGNAYTSSESNNIVIGDTPGVNGESNVLRIGFQGAMGASSITKTLIDGIAGVTTTVADAVPVLISASTGQLGTVSSSIRYKENVQDMADESSPLMKLRPVTFNYKKQGLKDYGLIAEEVAEIFPELVIFNDQGEPETVKYHILCSILLNEVQKLSKRIEKLESTE